MIKNKHYQKLFDEQNKLITEPNASHKRIRSQINLDHINGKPVPYDSYDAKDLQYNWKIHQSCRQK